MYKKLQEDTRNLDFPVFCAKDKLLVQENVSPLDWLYISVHNVYMDKSIRFKNNLQSTY